MFTTLGGSVIATNIQASDNDAQTFITAAGITDVTQRQAINSLVVDLKEANLWNKMLAIYPVVGGTASSHSYNLKDPRNLNAAYRLVFSGTWTHNANGMTPNNVTSAYANTFILPSTAFTSNKDIHVSYYSRTDNTTGGYEIGTSYDANSGRLQLICKYSTSNQAYGGYGSFVIGTNTDARGFFINNSNATNVQIIKNGNTLGTGTASLILSAYTTQTILLGAENRGGVIMEHSTKQCAFASIGNGLTSSEVSLYTDIVERYQTTLNRQTNKPIFALKSIIPRPL